MSKLSTRTTVQLSCILYSIVHYVSTVLFVHVYPFVVIIFIPVFIYFFVFFLDILWFVIKSLHFVSPSIPFPFFFFFFLHQEIRHGKHITKNNIALLHNDPRPLQDHCVILSVLRSREVLSGARAGLKVRLRLTWWSKKNSRRYSLPFVPTLIKIKLKNKPLKINEFFLARRRGCC